MIKLDKVLERWAENIGRETGQSSDVLLYGLKVIFNVILAYGLLISLAIVLKIPHVIITALTYSSLRVVTGGAHASTSARCITIGTVIFLVLGYLTQIFLLDPQIYFSTNFLVAIYSIGILLIAIYAPLKIAGRTYTKKRVSKLRALSAVHLTVWLGIMLWFLQSFDSSLSQLVVTSSAIGLAWQLITITPVGAKFIVSLERLIPWR